MRACSLSGLRELRSSLAFVVAMVWIAPLVAGVASGIQYDLPMQNACERGRVVGQPEEQ